MLTIYIDAEDVTNRVNFDGDFGISDNINQKRDTFDFEIRKAPGQTFFPEKGSEVIVEFGEGSDPSRIFGGTITSVERSVRSVNKVIYRCQAVDYSFILDRKLVLERFENTSVSDIIQELVYSYAEDFTFDNVVGDYVVEAISFNRIKISECLEKLAQITGYSWYVDYYKDIHFFPKNEEPAPFNLGDLSENFVWESLVIRDDFSQIRNSIVVQGGEIEGNEVSEEFTATGTEEERKLYRLAHKFAQMPAVYIGSTPITVGVEFLNDDADYEAMWDYNQKYLRFTPGNIPADTEVITVTGIPLYKLIGKLNDSESVTEHGVWEFNIKDDNIRSQEDMRSRALAELEAYKNGVTEGEFRTYESGLRSGQVITVQSTLLGVSEDYLIQSVNFSMRNTVDAGEWQVKLATLRTVGIIEFLQKLLRDNGKERDSGAEFLLSFFQYADETEVSDDISTPVVTSPPYTWEDEPPTPQTNPIVWNFFTWT